MARERKPPKEAVLAIRQGCARLAGDVFFGPLAGVGLSPSLGGAPFAADGYARLRVTPRSQWSGSGGRRLQADWEIEVNPWRRAAAEEWANVLGQALLHVHLGHLDPDRSGPVWLTACEIAAADFLRLLGFGTRPADRPYPEDVPGRSAPDIARALEEGGPAILARYAGLAALAGRGEPTWTVAPDTPPWEPAVLKARTDTLAAAIRASVAAAIETAGEAGRGPATARRNPNSMAERARGWFVAGYPLLAALAAGFEIVEDEGVCRALDIAVAAVNADERRVYINPRFPWTEAGMRFVMAHELLHVGLRHEPRRQGRDPYLWNVACDFVINGWLVEMGIGEMPTDTLLLDPELGLERRSAEEVYDRIVGDLRLIRRLNKARTLRGQGKVDMLGDRPPRWWSGPGTDLDAFYRTALAEGLDLHLRRNRGLLPGDLVEEVRALQQPPIPWDVQLGRWLDAHLPPLEARRSFARASRRQSATPDIPRPVWVRPDEPVATRTFGVVLDTSGSMGRRLLAMGLGAVAAYALSREVAGVRVVQCDAGLHDMGYVAPEALLGQVEVRGRGGTVLQPAIRALEADGDFPAEAPILVITDGACDVLTIRRSLAFLMPEGARLPFPTRAPLFRFDEG
ncbi:VWA-like domain-containing protein [uncultured Methylobacterium sp.]|uniref:vWA domain-containing protein n=1 Tax=uncultured Methylobacterium sp. TaxID=157278 RepID=UPI002615EBF8|nr:VWA-like domain-containing protein [uncultured Methylobacterium sp.]